jgi:hypothetical protein
MGMPTLFEALSQNGCACKRTRDRLPVDMDNRLHNAFKKKPSLHATMRQA